MLMGELRKLVTALPPPVPVIATQNLGPSQTHNPTTPTHGPILPNPAAPAHPHVGPLTGNPAAGASLSLLLTFPEVEETVIISVITHTLKGSDLYKLDSKYRDKADRGMLDFENGNIRMRTDTTTKDYPTPASIEIPLMVYFRIIIAHSAATGQSVQVALATLSYVESFLRLRADYEWSAVLAYHMAFFARRRREMGQGDYNGWKRIDIELQSEYLLGYRKTRTATSSSTATRKPDPNRGTDTCKLFNTGACVGTPCRNGRVHKCLKCSKADHGAHTCTAHA